MKHKTTFRFLCGAVMAFAVSTAHAQTWAIASGSDSMTDEDSWSPANVPGSSATVAFPSGTYTAKVLANYANTRANVGTGDMGSDIVWDIAQGVSYSAMVNLNNGGVDPNRLTITGKGTLNFMNTLNMGNSDWWDSNIEVVIDGATADHTRGDFLMGMQGENVRLIVQKGGVFDGRNGGEGYVSDNGTHNGIIVTNANSRFYVNGWFTIGSKKTDNYLHVMDGGKAFFGRGVTFGRNNSQNTGWVNGNGSELFVSSLSLGSAAGWGWNGTLQPVEGNDMTVENFGKLILDPDITPDGGTGTVRVGDGEGYMSDSKVQALWPSNNVLTIRSGGIYSNLFNSALHVGYRGGQNKVVVQDGLLYHRGIVVVGVFGSENTVEVGDNATFTSGDIYIGDQPEARGNRFSVRSKTATFSCPVLWHGQRGTENIFELANGKPVSLWGISVGNESTATSNVFTLAESTTLTYSGGTTVGNAGHFNTMLVSNATLKASTEGTHIFIVGNTGSSNTLIVTDGGSVVLDPAPDVVLPPQFTVATVGNESSAFGNQMILRSGGTFSNRWGGGMFWAGSNGYSNTVLIAEGGEFYSQSFTMVGANGFGNRMIVDNGKLNVRSDFWICDGWLGYDNALVVRGDKTKALIVGSVINGSKGGANFVEVYNDAVLTVGEYPWGGTISAGHANGGTDASGNEVRVHSGGVIDATTLTLGFTYSDVPAGKNFVHVYDGGVLIATNRSPAPGVEGGVQRGGGTIGYSSTCPSNTVLIGTGGTLFIGGDLTVLDIGLYSGDNALVVSNGVADIRGDLYLGRCDNVNNWIKVQGETPVIRSWSLRPISGTIQFDVPRAGYTNGTPFVVSGIYGSWIDVRAGLTINAQEWFDKKGGTLPLLTYEGGLSDAETVLEQYIAKAVMTPSEGMTLSIANGNTIVLTAPRKDRTMIFIR